MQAALTGTHDLMADALRSAVSGTSPSTFALECFDNFNRWYYRRSAGGAPGDHGACNWAGYGQTYSLIVRRESVRIAAPAAASGPLLWPIGCELSLC